MLQIIKWYGRFGNNVLQVLRALYAAEKLGHKYIQAPYHCYLKSRFEVRLITEKSSNDITNTFFDLNDLDLHNPSTLSLKKLVEAYRKQLFHPHIYSVLYNSRIENEMTIHVRGGDIFSKNPHPYYLQPPLYYYTKAIETNDSVNLIKEDSKNPVLSPLKKIDTITDISSNLLSDLNNLVNSKTIAFSASTFPFVAYLLSHKTKTIYMPDYYYDALPKGPWPDQARVILIELDNYIMNGNWKNNREQRGLMLSYKIQK